MSDCKICAHYGEPDAVYRFCDLCFLGDENICFKKIVTNGDRIRAMSDEELADLIERVRVLCATMSCGKDCPLKAVCYSTLEKPVTVLDLLRMEV